MAPSPLLAYLTSLPMRGPSRIARTTAANAPSSHGRPALDSPSSPGLRFLAGPLAGTVGLHFSAFITANVLGAVVYVPVIVAAGYGVGYGAGPQVERVLRTLGSVEYVVLTVAVVAAGTFFLWRASGA